MADQHGGTLYFFREYEEPYGFLSQWYEQTFVVNGTPYKCAEMYMMEQKAVTFDDEPSRRAILRAPTPRKQKALGRKVAGFDVKVWDERKYDVAVQGNFHKFSQAPDLKAKLLETGDRELVEASRFDRVWGIGFDAADAKRTDRECWGENLLGKALMEVRKRLREQDEAATAEGAAEKEDPVIVATRSLQRHPPADPSSSRLLNSEGKKKDKKGKGKNQK
ncbi:uncharacterized protein BKA78DRAFT_248003 [Phyllosticta capitalensis]